MRRILFGAVAVLLALPALHADPPKPKERYNALVKEFNERQERFADEIEKAEGEERQKLIQKYLAMTGEFGDKVLKIAEENPKDPVAVDALFWVVQTSRAGPARKKALDKVTELVAEQPLPDLMRRLGSVRGPSLELLEAAFQRAEKDAKAPQAADLLAWVAMGGRNVSIGQKAIKELIDKHVDSDAIEQLCPMLTRGYDAKNLGMLREILEKSTKPRVQAAAAIALGQALAGEADRLADDMPKADKVAADAEKCFVLALDKLDKAEGNAVKELVNRLRGRSVADLKEEAQIELKAVRTTRVGKTAPEIKAGDLDEKEFKLSDYRGKVVLLDFWGNW
jgi:hypothetical protein